MLLYEFTIYSVKVNKCMNETIHIIVIIKVEYIIMSY